MYFGSKHFRSIFNVEHGMFEFNVTQYIEQNKLIAQ